MGLIFVLFFSEEIAQLEAFKNTLKDEDKKQELQEIIDSLKEKQNEARTAHEA